MKKLILSVFLLVAAAFAQQTIDNSTALSVIPIPIKSTFPGVCKPGEQMYYAIGTFGANRYECGLTNNWILASGGGLTPATFAAPPAATLNKAYLFTDASATGVCTGGGSAYSVCIGNGTGFTASSGTSTGLGDPGSNGVVFRNAPGTSRVAIGSDYPTLNQSTSGNAATATAFAGTPTKCTAGSYTLGIDVGGNAQSCTPLPAFPSGTIIGASDVQTMTNKTVTSPSLGTGSSPLTETWTVGVGGVTVNTLVQTDASAPLKIIAATTGSYGIAMSTVSAAGSVEVARLGTVSCVTDTGGSTAGDLVVLGTGSPLNCKDSLQTSSSAIPISTRIIGVFRSTAIAGATALVELTPAHFGTQTAATATVTVTGNVAAWGSAVGKSGFTLALTSTTGNVTSSTGPTGLVVGATYSISVTTDALGGSGYTLVWPAVFTGGTTPAPTLPQIASTAVYLMTSCTVDAGGNCNFIGTGLAWSVIPTVADASVPTPVSSLTQHCFGSSTSLTQACKNSAGTYNYGTPKGVSGDVVDYSAGGVPQDSGQLLSGVTKTIGSGTISLGSLTVASAACSAAQTVTVTGTATTDTIITTFNGDPTGAVGFQPLTSGMLTVIMYPTANTVNAKVCNNTSSSITSGAVTINVRVVR